MNHLQEMGGEGFEPSTPWSQTKNHTRLDHPPVKPSKVKRFRAFRCNDYK